MLGASGEVGSAGSAFTEGPSVHRRKKQRARLLTEGEPVEKHGVAIPSNAVRQKAVLGGVAGGYGDLDSLPESNIRGVPIFVAVKTVTALDVLMGPSSTPALLDPSSTQSWVVLAGEKPRTAEEALLSGGWSTPRTHDFRGGRGGGHTTPTEGAAIPSVQVKNKVKKVKRKFAPQPAVPPPNHRPSRGGEFIDYKTSVLFRDY